MAMTLLDACMWYDKRVIQKLDAWHNSGSMDRFVPGFDDEMNTLAATSFRARFMAAVMLDPRVVGHDKNIVPFDFTVYEALERFLSESISAHAGFSDPFEQAIYASSTTRRGWITCPSPSTLFGGDYMEIDAVSSHTSP